MYHLVGGCPNRIRESLVESSSSELGGLHSGSRFANRKTSNLGLLHFVAIVMLSKVVGEEAQQEQRTLNCCYGSGLIMTSTEGPVWLLVT